MRRRGRDRAGARQLRSNYRMAITTDLATSFLFSPLVLSRASRWLCWLIFLLRLLLPRKRRLVACTSRTPARRSPAPLVLRVRRDARPPGAIRRHAPAHAAAPIVAVDDVIQHLLQVLQRVRLLHGAGDGGGRASSVRKRVLVMVTEHNCDRDYDMTIN